MSLTGKRRGHLTEYFFAEFALNERNHFAVLLAGKGQGLAGPCGAACTPGSVGISFGRVWDIIIDHVGNAKHINATGCNIGGNQNFEGAIPKTIR